MMRCRHIEVFWETVRSMTAAEKSALINFCSGRSRLPVSLSEYGMKFKLVAPPPLSEKDPDNYLPVAQTCFFCLSLPRYSSVEICAKRLRYAIKNTELMDADFNVRNANGWETIR
jgi:E3 ubiquitin-protein ligase HERC2